MRELLVDSGDVRLAVRDQAGPESAIIFLHFGGGNLAMWQQAMSHFGGRHRLVLIDLRGHGRSDRPAAGYHIDTMATDVVGVMQALGMRTRANLVCKP